MIGTVSDVTNAIRTFQDTDYSGFSGFPVETSVGEVWADVADTLLANVIPQSGTAPAARQSFIAAMQGVTHTSDGPTMLYAAFMSYATTLAGGMTTSGFVGTPPPTLVTFPLTGLITQSAEVEAGLMATALVVWAKTGTAIPSTGGATILWS